MDKRSKYKALTFNTILFTISSFGSKFISFLFLPLYTSILSTQDYGEIEIVITTAQLLIPILTVGIQDAVLRYSLDEKYQPKDVITCGIQVIASGFFLLSAILTTGCLTNLIQVDSRYLLFLLFYFLSNALLNTFSMYLRAMDKVRLIVCAALLHTALMCALNIVFLAVLRLGVTGYFLANIVATIFNDILLFFVGGIYREVQFRFVPPLLKAMIRYSIPLAFGSLAWWINNVSDRYIVTFFCGLEANGVYSIAYKIPTILTTIQGVFYNAWSVSAITNYNPEDKDGFVGNVYSMYSGVSFLGCSFILLGNVFLAKLLYAKSFFTAWCYVPLLLLGAVFNGMALFEGCIFTAAKKSATVAATTIVGSIVNTLLNFLLIYTMGPIGAALATMIGYFVIWMFRTAWLKTIISIKVNWKRQWICIVTLFIQVGLALSGNFRFQIPVALILLLLCHSFLCGILKETTGRLKNRPVRKPSA